MGCWLHMDWSVLELITLTGSFHAFWLRFSMDRTSKKKKTISDILSLFDFIAVNILACYSFNLLQHQAWIFPNICSFRHEYILIPISCLCANTFKWHPRTPFYWKHGIRLPQLMIDCAFCVMLNIQAHGFGSPESPDLSLNSEVFFSVTVVRLGSQ